MKKKISILFILSFLIVICTSSMVRAAEIPARDASAGEIYRYFEVNIEREKNGEIDFVEDVLLEINDPMCTILRQWRTTLQEEVENLQRMIRDGVDAMGNTATQTQIEGFRLQQNCFEELIVFLTEAINIRQTGESNVEGDVDAFINADQTAEEYAYHHFTNAEGEDRETFEFTDVLINLNNYIPGDEPVPEGFVSILNTIITVITNIGMIISVLIIAILGIKYMLGSVEEKAEYKKDMIPYIVGAVLLFGITAIVKVVQQIGESINNI